MQTLRAVGRYPQWCSASGQRYPAEMEEMEGLMEGLMRGKGAGKTGWVLKERKETRVKERQMNEGRRRRPHLVFTAC